MLHVARLGAKPGGPSRRSILCRQQDRTATRACRAVLTNVMRSCRPGRKGELPKPAAAGPAPFGDLDPCGGGRRVGAPLQGRRGGPPVPEGAPWPPEPRQTLGHRPVLPPAVGEDLPPRPSRAATFSRGLVGPRTPEDQALGNKKSTSYQAALSAKWVSGRGSNRGPGPASAKTANLSAPASARRLERREEQNFILQRGLAPCYQRRPCAFPLPSFAAP